MRNASLDDEVMAKNIAHHTSNVPSILKKVERKKKEDNNQRPAKRKDILFT